MFDTFIFFFDVYFIDEAETSIAFTSNWLELDASDDWVRTDAETVSRLTILPNSSISS